MRVRRHDVERVVRAAARVVAGARVEAALLALLLLTLLAVAWQDRILERSVRLTPERVALKQRIVHSDKVVGGASTARETGPFRWSCDLRKQFDYPYCGYEVFLGAGSRIAGVDLSNLRSMRVTLVYRGPAKSFRVHLKNFDPRYSKRAEDDTPKFNRVEHRTTPGVEQQIDFAFTDFGVADWWLVKHGLPPSLSHPQFDNVTSIDVQTGSDSTPGHHEFEIREIVVRSAVLGDAQWYLLLLSIWSVLLVAYLLHRLHNLRNELERGEALQALAQAQAQQAAMAARLDELTQVYNRRGVAERYAELCGEGIEPAPVAVIMIDIDGFKSLNDRFGHAYGDEVLSSIAMLIKRNIGTGDTLGRWGGEEFLVICPGIDAEGAMIVAEKLRRRIEHFHFGECERVTASFGVHCCPAPGPDLLALVSHADVALYAAKHDGRNLARLFRAGMAKAA